MFYHRRIDKVKKREGDSVKISSLKKGDPLLQDDLSSYRPPSDRWLKQKGYEFGLVKEIGMGLLTFCCVHS